MNYTEEYDVFISYRRDGGEAMAILLRDRLTERGYKVFLDIENLNSGSFNIKLLDVIDNCTDFLLICSIDSLNRCINEGDWVRTEITRALEMQKNIVPIMLRGFEFPESLPEEIEAIRMQNGVNANSHEYFDAAIYRLEQKFLKSEPKISIPEMSERLQNLVAKNAQTAKKIKKIKTAAAVLTFCIIGLIFVFIYSDFGGETAEIIIRNNTEDTIHSIYLKRSDIDDWGRNIIENPLLSGETISVKIPFRETELRYNWDMQSIFFLGEVTRTYTLEGFSMYQVSSIIIYLDENGEYERKFIRNNFEEEERNFIYEYEGFFTDGTTLYDANGNPFVMRGINYPHTWFKNQLEVALPAIAATGANTVRVVLSDGSRWTKDGAGYVSRIIELCKELKMIAVLEVHDATGKNDVESLMHAVDYWIELKDVLIGNEPYVILNPVNEWFGKWESKGWRDGYVPAIRKLREAGIRNTLMIDAAGWGQYPKSIFDEGKFLIHADELRNIVFSIHMYEYAGGTPEIVRSNIDSALKAGAPVVIGEFGHRHSDGDVAFEEILRYCEEIGVGYIGWSWKGNSGGVEYLDIALEWDGSAFSEDWGEILINSEFGIRETSRLATIFK